MRKIIKIKLDQFEEISQKTEARLRDLSNSLVLFAISEEYKDFLILRGFDFETEIADQFKLGFFENLVWLETNDIFDSIVSSELKDFQKKAEILFSQIKDTDNWQMVINQALTLLEKLSIQKDYFDFTGRYVIFSDDKIEPLKSRIKTYIIPFIGCFIFVTILSLLSRFNNSNDYNNPIYIGPLISFIGSIILFATIIQIEEIAKPKRKTINLEKLKSNFDEIDTMIDDGFLEFTYKNYFWRLDWDNWNNFNNYKSSLFIQGFFESNVSNHENLKLKDKRLELLPNCLRMTINSGYYKLPDKNNILKKINSMIEIFENYKLEPISGEEIKVQESINIIMRNEYAYREEHLYQ